MGSFARFEFKVLASFSAAVLVVAGLVVTTWYVANEATESFQAVARSHEMLESLARTGNDTLQTEFSTQSFRFSGDPARLAERDAAVAAREIQLDRIKTLASDNPHHQSRWRQLRKLIDERIAISRRIEQIRKTDSQEAATAFASAAPLQETRQRINRLLHDMEDEERALLAVRVSESQRAQQLLIGCGTAAGVLLLALLTTTFAFIRRQMHQSELSRNAAIASEQNLSTTLNSIGDGVIATDSEACITRMNPVAEQLTGWSLDQAIGRPVGEVFEIIHEHTRAPARGPVQDVLLSGEVRQLANHTVLIDRKGVERPIADSAAPIRDAAGHVNGVVLVFRDVGSSRRAQQFAHEQNESLERRVLERTLQLQESNERYKTLFRTSPDALALTTLSDGRYLDINDGFSRLFGWESEEVIGKTSKDINIWRNWGDRSALLQAMEKSGRCEGLEAEFVSKSGKAIATLVSAQAIEMGNEKCMISVTHDITARQELVQTLNDARHFTHRVVNSLTEHIAVLDASGKIVSVNDAWIRFAKDNGVADPDLTGVGVNYLDICARSSQSQSDEGSMTAMNGIRALLSGELPGFVMEYPCHSPQEQRWFELHAVPLLGHTGGAVLIHQDITDRKRADEVLRASEDSYHRQFVENSVVMLLIDTPSGAIVDANVAAQRFYGYSLAQLQALTIAQINTLSSAELQSRFETLLSTGRGLFEAQHRLASGDLRDVEVSASLMLFRGRQIVHSIIHDITDRRRSERLVRESEQHFRTIANGGSLLIWTSGLDRLCNYFNEPWLRFTGRSIAQEVGNGWTEGVHPEDRDRCLQIYISAFDHRQTFSMDHRLWHASGSYRWIRNDGNPRYDSQGEFLGYIGFCMDITERKASAEQIEHLAFYDPLTQLPNRRLMLDRLGQALSNSARRHRHGAVLMIDLDNFKSLNDTLGHHIGDQLLIEVAARLHSCIRVGDTVSRLGGDEFVAILEDLDEGQQAAINAEYVADKILTCLSAPYFLNLQDQFGKAARVTHHCTSSIGIALFREEPVTSEELIKRADTAMYQAKSAGRNSKRFFDPKMQAAVNVRAKLESDLRLALEHQEFVLHYQVQVDDHNQVVGAEALIRWQHAEEGLVPPNTFIPVAEETGLIIPIGNWVLATACAQLARWASNAATSDLTLAVNVSASQFRLPHFVEQVLAVISDSGARPEKLKLELTESLLLDNAEDIIAKMNLLKAFGVRFSLDDFGTGYSSLAYLKRLPLDQLKIDKSFVRDVLIDPNDAAIATTVVALSRSLGIAVIAEGVETEGQRKFLADAGCLMYQGYLFGRPLPLADFEALIIS